MTDGRHNEELRDGGLTAPGSVIDIEIHASSKFDDWVLVRFATRDGTRIESKLYEDDFDEGKLPGVGSTVVVRYAASNPSGSYRERLL